MPRVATPAVLLMVIPSVITMGADLLAMAAAFQLLTGVKYIYWVVPLAGVMAVVTIFLDYRVVSRYMLWLVGFLAMYVIAAFLARPDWLNVVRSTVVPSISLDGSYIAAAVAMLGTTISPYLFFWQASGEVEEKRGVQHLARTNVDITVGMIWSNVTAFFIVVATGAVLFTHHAHIRTAADAARALEPFVGQYATVHLRRRHHRCRAARHPGPRRLERLRNRRPRGLASRPGSESQERSAVLRRDRASRSSSPWSSPSPPSIRSKRSSTRRS